MPGTALILAVPDRYDVTPGLLGFTVVFAIGVALWLLLRSLNRHLGRITVPHDERAVARRGLAARRHAPQTHDEQAHDEQAPPAGTGT